METAVFCAALAKLLHDVFRVFYLTLLSEHQWRVNSWVWSTGGVKLTVQNLKYADRNCPTAAMSTTNPGNESRSASWRADNWVPEPRHCLAGWYESPFSCILFDSPWLSAQCIRAILTSLLICDAILLPKFNIYFPHYWFLDRILNVITVNLLYALQYTVDLVKWQQKHNTTRLYFDCARAFSQYMLDIDLLNEQRFSFADLCAVKNYKSPHSAENRHLILCIHIYFISNIKHFLTNLQTSHSLYTTINHESWNSHGGMYEDSSLEWTNRHSAVWITTYCLCDIISGDTCLWHNVRWHMFMWHNVRWHVYVT